MKLLKRDFFEPDALGVAPKLLGKYFTLTKTDGEVTIKITEVEAYHGVGASGKYDPGSHSKDRKTLSNASMFGPPGHAYVYFNYGMHYAMNIVCSPDGVASGVLVRAGEVVSGVETARQRRLLKRSGLKTRTALKNGAANDEGGKANIVIKDFELARGPGNLATAMGITRAEFDGADLLQTPFAIGETEELIHEHQIVKGARVGVSGVGGSEEFPWRFWVAGDRTVSAFRRG